MTWTIISGTELDDEDYQEYGSGGVLPDVPLRGEEPDSVQKTAFLSALLLMLTALLLFVILAGALWLWRNCWGYRCRMLPRFYMLGKLWGSPLPNNDDVEMEMDYYHT